VCYSVHYYVHMDAKRIIPISEARKRIFEIADEVQKPDTHYVLTENGKPKAVILSAEQFEDLLDDLDILSDPELAERIEEAERQYEAGDYITWEELKKELHIGSEELSVRDIGKEKYQIKQKPKAKKKPTKKRTA
jgi:antitoxin YefM